MSSNSGMKKVPVPGKFKIEKIEEKMCVNWYYCYTLIKLEGVGLVDNRPSAG